MKPSEIIARVTSLAGAANEERNPLPRPPGVVPPVGLPEGETHLETFLLAQPAEVVYLLAAVMELGRGDLEAAVEVSASIQEMRALGEELQPIVEQMVDTPPLHEYLEHGLKKLRAAGVDVDALLTWR